MDEATTTDPVDKLELPKESRISYMLNGAGNGVMLCGFPFLLYDVLKGKAHGTNKITLFASVTGAVLGSVYGLHEGKRVHNYREAVNQELLKLRHDLDTHKHTGKLTAS